MNNFNHDVKEVKVNPGMTVYTIFVELEFRCCMPSLKIIGLFVLEKKIFNMGVTAILGMGPGSFI